MDLSELPVHLLEDLFSQVSQSDLSRVERASKTLFTLTRSDRAFWKAAIQARWGPVQPLGDSASVDDWISLGKKLEVHVRGLILRSVRQSQSVAGHRDWHFAVVENEARTHVRLLHRKSSRYSEDS